jgi:hypothetical protein
MRRDRFLATPPLEPGGPGAPRRTGARRAAAHGGPARPVFVDRFGSMAEGVSAIISPISRRIARLMMRARRLTHPLTHHAGARSHASPRARCTS